MKGWCLVWEFNDLVYFFSNKISIKKESIFHYIVDILAHIIPQSLFFFSFGVTKSHFHHIVNFFFNLIFQSLNLWVRTIEISNFTWAITSPLTTNIWRDRELLMKRSRYRWCSIVSCGQMGIPSPIRAPQSA